MNTINFIEEVKAAISGRWKKKTKTKPKKIHKTPEEIWNEETENYINQSLLDKP